MKLPSLTGVRGIAALWVVLFHLQQYGDAFGLPAMTGLPILRTGWAGVDLFFVLSGFVLMLVHERDFPCLAWAPAARFAWLRFFRVYPLATVVLLLILLLTLLDPGFTAYWAHSAIPHNFTVSSFFRTLESLISMGRFMPAITSVRPASMTDIARFEGVPPNMSVSTITPAPVSARPTAATISRRRCSISSSAPIDTVSKLS